MTSIPGTAPIIVNITLNATNATTENSYFSKFNEYKTSTIATLENIPTQISNLFTTAQTQIQESFSTHYSNSTVEQYVNVVRNNESLNGIKESLVNNSTLIGGTASTVGGYIAADAGVKLLRQEKGVSLKKEVIKLGVAAGVIVASESICPSSDRATLTVCAMAGALINTAWKAATNPVTHHFYVLKSSN